MRAPQRELEPAARLGPQLGGIDAQRREQAARARRVLHPPRVQIALERGPLDHADVRRRGIPRARRHRQRDADERDESGDHPRADHFAPSGFVGVAAGFVGVSGFVAGVSGGGVPPGALGVAGTASVASIVAS